MPQIPWTVKVRDHPGSSAAEIERESQWDATHPHRVGFKTDQNRIAGITHSHDETTEEIEEARQHYDELQKEIKDGDLVNFREVVQHQKDFHLEHPENRPAGWRYVLNTTENWVKNEEPWPANLAKKKKEEEARAEEGKANVNSSNDSSKQEHEREAPMSKHHPAYGRNPGSEAASSSEQDDSSSATSQDSDEKDTLESKYSPQEIALLKVLQHEKDYISKLEQSDGKQQSPQKHNRTSIAIDEQDQFTPDNWVTRESNLIRLTGKHPLNAEAPLSKLFEAGLITPNELHYVRNHGSVPRLLWEFHKLDIGNGKLTLSMDDLKNNYQSINIPIALACDGNRRKELNMIKRSKGFNWGAGGVSCAYWKGPLLRDVLATAGILEEELLCYEKKRYWVNFEGADSPSEGKYQTCIPYDYAVDPTNDVILAYEMNDVPLPADHGYPIRLMIPGYVGGRCVKWLHKIWISEKENDSYYHIWDNRVLPSFVTSKDGEFAETLFRHPDTACNEQNLNSVVVKPAHGERISLTSARHGNTYRIEGYAYDGGGHEVQRVEVSLDAGETWLYCLRMFPERPIRHGNKFWSWLHWHVDVEVSHLVRAPEIAVRCFNVFKNTQPEKPTWNVMGMMNNCWYKVKLEISEDGDNDHGAAIYCRHPVEPGTGDGGWMKPSIENSMATLKQEAGTPQKQFTREEVEKHDLEDDCWIVVDNKVYDATSVLEWHPGGKAAIIGHAGKVHQQTTEEFASVHDDYAYSKLKECVIGTLTEKAAAYVKETAKEAAKEAAKDAAQDGKTTLQKHKWVPVKLINREELSRDTRRYTFALPNHHPILGLGTCQHVQLGFHLEDKMLVRSYTPTRPLLPASSPSGRSLLSNNISDSERSSVNMHDGQGKFDLTIKTYFPDNNQPGGALSNIIDCLPLGSEVELKGPTGDILYSGDGNFIIEGKERHFDCVSLVLGGSGITPGYALIARILLTEGKSDKTQIKVIDANTSEGDILLREELSDFAEGSDGQLTVTHILSHPSDEWKGLKGHVDKDIITRNLHEPKKENVVFLCGPPAMIQKAALPALKDWGYVEDENMFGF